MNDMKMVNAVFSRVVAELAVSEVLDVDKLDAAALNNLRKGIGVVLGVWEPDGELPNGCPAPETKP